MKKTTIVFAISVFFLIIGVSILPHRSWAVSSENKDIKTLQYFVDIGRLPFGIKKQIEERGKAEVIVTFDSSEATEKAKQLRTAKGLRFDNAEIINEKARINNLKKRKALSEIPAYDYTVLKDYEKFSVVYLEINENALRKLLQNPNVKAIGENNISVPSLSESLPLVHAPEAYSLGATGAGASVAVLDTGVDYTGSTFGSCTAPGVPANCKVVHAQDIAPDDYSLDNPLNRHGTLVSGIVVGVAPDTKLIVLDVFRGAYVYDSDWIAALEWIYNNRDTFPGYPIKAVNMSLNRLDSYYTAPCPEDNLASPIADLKSAGIISVIASGNYAFTDAITSPACIPDAISVGAVCDSSFNTPSPEDWYGCSDISPTFADMTPCWSNSATFLTMLAPGAIIYAPIGTYGIIGKGTSLAAAHVTGAVVAVRDMLPGLAPNNVRALITSTGVPVEDGRNNIIKPRLDLLNALPTTCSNYPVKIAGGAYYNSLQAAYDAAGNGDIIQTNKTIMIGNLYANRNISVTVKGGYDCNFTTSNGNAFTYVKGRVQGTSGALSMKNIILLH